ncbi:MAG: hypothetical protein K8R31_00125 [Bacteroidales bacterium]|nr:hypothetical protein [Bacteroidales bacterium]
MNKEEYRKKLNQLGKRKDLISGVHNYCDRWCERCPFTSKCGSFALSEGFNDDQESKDIENEKFWDDLKIVFEVTLEMLKEQAEELGIDLDNLDDVDYKHEVVENDTVKMSKDYGIAILDWIKDNNKEINNLGKRLLLINENEVLKFQDAVEVIQWYSLFISAKIHRAFMDYGIDDEDNYDNLGSAKIALIAIDRSIAALGYLLENMPSFEDDILNFLAKLSKIKKYVLTSFPTAMEFKRPGFDD